MKAWLRRMRRYGLRPDVPRAFEPLYRVLVGTHHKTGTVWMSNVFRNIAATLGLRFHPGGQPLPPDADIHFEDHSLFVLSALTGPYRGIHLIRDPRDRIVSGCFYHLKSHEAWLHVKQDRFGGLSYQEKLNSLSTLDDQLLFEMENSARHDIDGILAWDYTRPEFLELKYEDLIEDRDLTLFHEIFVFLGFPGSVIPNALRIAYDNSLFSGPLNSQHIRSGKSRQWPQYLKDVHRERFVALFGDALVRLGYETGGEWVGRASVGAPT